MGIEHPELTTATVKLLYACAFACAYPGCGRPLYREDEATGAWTLNSRICHIHARREGGPRWDSQQLPEDNRAEHNLMLMCLDHASAIDDPRTIDSYPASLLKEWKKAQIEDFRNRMEGWPLTKAMAEQAIAASFSHVGIAINQSTVDLGGKGGQAPWAGGGGGGVIGNGSRGGRGGDGGKHYNLADDDVTLPTSMLEEMLLQAGVSPEQMPGAGGGGAGIVGKNSVGGNGGNGGDSATATLAVESRDVLEYEIGKGGKGASLPGQHGQDGGDTVIRVRSADGTLKQIIRVNGGAGGKAGELPDGAMEISEIDLTSGFHISTLLPANYVEIRDGLLFVVGGGWSRFNVPQLPHDVIWHVVCAANWSALNPPVARWLQLCLLNPHGIEVSRIAFELPPYALNGTNVQWLLPIGAPLNNEGHWKMRVQSGGFILSEVRVNVAMSQ